MTNTKSRYIHNEKIHNLESSMDFVSFIYNTFMPNSVIDFGCGLGNFLHSFKNLGVKEVKGVDGPWVEKAKRAKFLKDDEFIVHDLQLPLRLSKKYDLVLSLEVGEHLSENAAGTLVENLVSAGDIIIFSAAVPYQGGQNHINEQWQSYWAKQFARNDYILLDIIRPSIWENQKISWWYRQNSFVYAQKDISIDSIEVPIIRDMIHPELYLAKVNKLKEKEEQWKSFQEGKLVPVKYLKLFLKSVFKR